MNSGLKGYWSSKLFGVCLGAGVFALSNGFSFADETADLTGMSAHEVSVCEYDRKDLSLSLEIQAARLGVDHERRGFFRIGLLPIFVVEDVRIRIASADCLTNALSVIDTWRPSESVARRLELRQLEISYLGKKFPCLRAAAARLEPDGKLDLTNVSWKDASGVSQLLPHAVLWATGPHAGKLIWNTSEGRHEAILFSPRNST